MSTVSERTPVETWLFAGDQGQLNGRLGNGLDVRGSGDQGAPELSLVTGWLRSRLILWERGALGSADRTVVGLLFCWRVFSNGVMGEA
jgi:hypothetical protein